MNKKLFTLLISTLSLLMSFTSCSEEAFDVDSVNKQTVIVFFPWTGSQSTSGLTEDLKHNLDSIRQGIIDRKGLNNTRVLVFFSNNYKESTLYDLQYDEAKKTVNDVIIKNYDEANYNTAEGLAAILNDVKQNAEALNYALIIGGHGCGWTYSDDWVHYPYNARPYGANKQTSQSNSTSSPANGFAGIQFGSDLDRPLTRFFGSVSLSSNAIDISNLAEGIKLSGLKMQYILFDACYMSNVETAYELKDVTNYMIGSTSEILAAGLPYRTLWSSLNSVTPNYTNIVSSTINFYKRRNEPYCNLAAIDCRQMDKLAEVMKDINAKYALSSNVSLESIQHLDGFSPNMLFDLKNYVDSLKPSGYLKDRFTNQLNLTIKAAQSTENVITALSPGRVTEIPIKTFCGLTVSDPSQHSVVIKGKEKTGWWKATH